MALCRPRLVAQLLRHFIEAAFVPVMGGINAILVQIPLLKGLEFPEGPCAIAPAGKEMRVLTVPDFSSEKHRAVGGLQRWQRDTAFPRQFVDGKRDDP